MRIIRLYVDLPLNAETRVELPEGAAPLVQGIAEPKWGTTFLCSMGTV